MALAWVRSGRAQACSIAGRFPRQWGHVSLLLQAALAAACRPRAACLLSRNHQPRWERQRPRNTAHPTTTHFFRR